MNTVLELRAALDTLEIEHKFLKDRVQAMDQEKVMYVTEQEFERRMNEKGEMVEKRLKEMYNKTVSDAQDIVNSFGKDNDVFHDVRDPLTSKEGALHSGPLETQRGEQQVGQQPPQTPVPQTPVQENSARNFFGFGTGKQEAQQQAESSTRNFFGFGAGKQEAQQPKGIPELGGATSAREMWSRETVPGSYGKAPTTSGERKTFPRNIFPGPEMHLDCGSPEPALPQMSSGARSSGAGTGPTVATMGVAPPGLAPTAGGLGGCAPFPPQQQSPMLQPMSAMMWKTLPAFPTLELPMDVPWKEI